LAYRGKKIKPKAIRFSDGPKKGYERASLADALKRYPASGKVKHPQQPSSDGDNSSNSTRNKTTDVTARKTPETPHDTTTVTGVTGVTGGANGVPERPATYMSRLDVPAGDAPESDLSDDCELHLGGGDPR
jgi:hypothetical protein